MPTQPTTPPGVSVPDLRDAEWARGAYQCRSVKLVYYLAAKGEIPCVRIGRRVYFDIEAVREHIRRGGGAEVVLELKARRSVGRSTTDAGGTDQAPEALAASPKS